MKKFNPEQHRIETASALEIVRIAENVDVHAAYVGLDVHKETIAVAVAEPGREEPIYGGEIANKPKSVAKLLAKLSETYDGGLLLFCYEAGPCGYVLYRRILASGHDCQVIAPSRIPKAPGERIENDRRDALKLARLLRGGDLTAVWVPDQEQERMGDLSRARDDMKGQGAQVTPAAQWLPAVPWVSLAARQEPLEPGTRELVGGIEDGASLAASGVGGIHRCRARRRRASSPAQRSSDAGLTAMVPGPGGRLADRLAWGR
jgi:hypothetical protein